MYVVSRKRVLTVSSERLQCQVYHEAFEDLKTCKFLPCLDANDPESWKQTKAKGKTKHGLTVVCFGMRLPPSVCSVHPSVHCLVVFVHHIYTHNTQHTHTLIASVCSG